MIKALQFIIISLGLISATMLQAEQNGIYRWTDDQGVVQYSDRPPEGVEAVFIKTSTGKRSTPSAAKTAQSDDDADEGSESSSQTMEVMPEKDPKLCEQAKRNLKALESARIRITEPDGSKRILTEDEKEGQRANANKFIKVHC
ncbi:DUF4124 domain-containing protein [Oceanicoccus sagamiensis]|uniref:DUF4124 domain-containing protein n=1 Tax=Oceanicoccus sagamiensis TaxID=716816 RepID=A0A1X9N3Q3_9GAMM|nr:DUF4124 domain-containing protein [Oceanicoccus sagamiensis]ARN72818.1 hypothetical protein BST96_01070 [Oceanicoccus sagamiensis]